MLLVTFILMVLLSGVAAAVAVFAQNSVVSSRANLLDKQAFYIAEAGAQRARQALSIGTWTAASSAGNTYTESFGVGEYRVTVVDQTTPAEENADTNYTITSEGYVPSQAAVKAKRELVEDTIDVTPANTNRSLAATAAASSENGSNTAAKSNDGSTGTKWQAGTKGGSEWLRLDYGSATTVDRMIIKDDGNISSTITVEYSDDASAWTGVGSQATTESPNNTFAITFTAASHRYFRAKFPDVASGNRAGVKEFESYSTASRTVTYNAPGTVTTIW